jgi:hypothetical protein
MHDIRGWGMNRVRAGLFSLTPPLSADEDAAYLQWHLLDHMPEQFQLPGIVHAHRWIADGAYLDHRLAGSGPLSNMGSVVNYLVSEPVEQTAVDFLHLGRRLAELGRYPHARPSLQVRALALQRWYAAPQALVSAEVVPFRPHRGVLFLVERPLTDDATWQQWLHREHLPALLSLPGVAGAWMYGSTSIWRLPPALTGDPQFVTVIYLDEDPLEVCARARPLLEKRWDSGAVEALFAGPLRSMIEWEAWP